MPTLSKLLLLLAFFAPKAAALPTKKLAAAATDSPKTNSACLDECKRNSQQLAATLMTNGMKVALHWFEDKVKEEYGNLNSPDLSMKLCGNIYEKCDEFFNNVGPRNALRELLMTGQCSRDDVMCRAVEVLRDHDCNKFCAVM